MKKHSKGITMTKDKNSAESVYRTEFTIMERWGLMAKGTFDNGGGR